MRSRFSRWAAVTAATALSLASLLPQVAGAQPAPSCSFRSPGFGDFVPVVSVDIVGTCRENEHPNSYNGNVEQLTANGLLYWRPCDNITGFTDGYVTWMNGPSGLQNRLSTDARFDWEPNSSCSPLTTGAPQTPLAPAPPAPAPAVTAPTPAPTPAPPPMPPVPARVDCPSNTISVRNTDLSFLNRQGVNYLCADAYHAKLLGTDFSGANLVQANLQASELTRANFSGAHLTLAVLVLTTSSGSKQSPGPNFSGADLRGAKISASKLPYADFRYADLSNADLSRSLLTGGDLRGADLRAADLSQADFTDANLTGAYLCGANTTGTIFLRAVGVSTSCS
jgi:hypothetical protein